MSGRPVPKPAPRERLKPGQRMRKPLAKLGRIGKAWKPFQQECLRRWFDRALSSGARPTVTADGWERLDIPRRHMPGEPGYGSIERRVGTGGIMHYRGDGVQVGHKEGRGRDRHPEDRHNYEAVEPQSPRFNRHLESIAQREEQDT